MPPDKQILDDVFVVIILILIIIIITLFI